MVKAYLHKDDVTWRARGSGLAKGSGNSRRARRSWYTLDVDAWLTLEMNSMFYHLFINVFFNTLNRKQQIVM